MSQMKIVIALNSEKSSVGISKPDCDPIFNVVEGGLDAVIARLPELVRTAEEKFAAAPRNPQSNLPEPKPAPAPAHTGAARSSPASARGKDASRPSLFQ
jgi:hypothetical protein